jgi:hypothetical protein
MLEKPNGKERDILNLLHVFDASSISIEDFSIKVTMNSVPNRESFELIE